MADELPPIPKRQTGLGPFLARNSQAVIAVMVVLGLIVVSRLRKSDDSGADADVQPGALGDLSGLQRDAQGRAIVYVPTSYSSYSSSEQYYDLVSTTTINNNPAPPAPSTPPAPAPDMTGSRPGPVPVTSKGWGDIPLADRTAIGGSILARGVAYGVEWTGYLDTAAAVYWRLVGTVSRGELFNQIDMAVDAAMRSSRY